MIVDQQELTVGRYVLKVMLCAAIIDSIELFTQLWKNRLSIDVKIERNFGKFLTYFRNLNFLNRVFGKEQQKPTHWAAKHQ